MKKAVWIMMLVFLVSAEWTWGQEKKSPEPSESKDEFIRIRVSSLDAPMRVSVYADDVKIPVAKLQKLDLPHAGVQTGKANFLTMELKKSGVEQYILEFQPKDGSSRYTGVTVADGDSFVCAYRYVVEAQDKDGKHIWKAITHFKKLILKEVGHEYTDADADCVNDQHDQCPDIPAFAKPPLWGCPTFSVIPGEVGDVRHLQFLQYIAEHRLPVTIDQGPPSTPLRLKAQLKADVAEDKTSSPPSSATTASPPTSKSDRDQKRHEIIFSAVGSVPYESPDHLGFEIGIAALWRVKARFGVDLALGLGTSVRKESMFDLRSSVLYLLFRKREKSMLHLSLMGGGAWRVWGWNTSGFVEQSFTGHVGLRLTWWKQFGIDLAPIIGVHRTLFQEDERVFWDQEVVYGGMLNLGVGFLCWGCK